MNTKPQMKYRVVQGRNPRTGGAIQRPLIVDRETYAANAVFPTLRVCGCYPQGLRLLPSGSAADTLRA